MDHATLTSLMAVVLTRATERILVVLVGALAIYLGYRLFQLIPMARKGANQGEGKIELPGGVSIFLTRIGPGIFFALFGAGVIAYAATKPIEFNPPGTATIASARPAYTGFGQGDTRPVPTTVAPNGSAIEPEHVVAKLNGFLQESQRRLSAPAASELATVVRAAKFAVMLGRWKPEWGDRTLFDRWVRENGDKDPPPDLVPGATVIFRTEL
jgi:branched-subunit amino acid transport protein